MLSRVEACRDAERSRARPMCTRGCGCARARLLRHALTFVALEVGEPLLHRGRDPQAGRGVEALGA
eukprot:2456518-Prymnesium_polylepis.1